MIRNFFILVYRPLSKERERLTDIGQFLPAAIFQQTLVVEGDLPILFWKHGFD